MANEQRSRTNLVNGTLSVALASGDTTMSSAGLANLAAITAANHAVIIIENEIIYVTAHTAAATTATILRGQEGTSAAAHSINVAWVHGEVVSDFYSVLGYTPITSTVAGIATGGDVTGLTVTVTVPYAGHRIKITAHGQTASSATAAWSLDFQEGATVLGRVGYNDFPGANTGLQHGSVLIVPTAASHTYKITATRATGSGTLSVQAAATTPAFILVEDLGPAL